MPGAAECRRLGATAILSKPQNTMCRLLIGPAPLVPDTAPGGPGASVVLDLPRTAASFSIRDNGRGFLERRSSSDTALDTNAVFNLEAAHDDSINAMPSPHVVNCAPLAATGRASVVEGLTSGRRHWPAVAGKDLAEEEIPIDSAIGQRRANITPETRSYVLVPEI